MKAFVFHFIHEAIYVKTHCENVPLLRGAHSAANGRTCKVIMTTGFPNQKPEPLTIEN